ncbi:MAG: aldehyde ferredoxin oxidoreductase family protein [Desulfobacterales bacterium]|jgi:aldehyde:ferredoxin oxidoreductase|nr:aldehyde ferredoxin oxidoreductase family protein [Desulfobacterales bacterium]
MHGWCGTILRVDLTRGTIATEKLDPRVARSYIGARGFGIYYLRKEVDPRCDPLGPFNTLIMAAGPLTGTAAPTGARYVVTTKSPLTGAITCSNSGGNFPAELKKSGIDAILFEGRAERPVYLWVDRGRAELRPAGHLWGLTTHQTDEALRRETDEKAKTAVIGPAGERRVLFAAIMNDRDRAAGRAGVGAVMGAKNLKAVVVRGEGEVALADPAGFKAANARYRDAFKAKTKDNPPPLRTHGTAITVVGTQSHGVFPTRNFQQGTFEGWESIYGETLTRKYLLRAKPCFSCPIACGRVTRIPDGPFAGEGEGPEYETVYALGSDCGVDDLAALTKANYECNELGLDTISMGSTIACAMELYEKGLLKESETGMPLRWGDGQALVELVRLTARREGFGDVLAEGSLRLATRYGRPELAMVAKGLDFAGYDPRGEQGMGLAYATSPIGGSHMRGDPAYFELLGVPTSVDPHTWTDKPPLVAKWQDLFCVIDAAGLCVFFSVRYLVEQNLMVKPVGITELLNAATGAGYTPEEVERAGERIFNAERLFLLAAGFTRGDDRLPPRIVSEPMPSGPAKGMVCRLEEMLGPYYELRGWSAGGGPCEAKLKELGLL